MLSFSDYNILLTESVSDINGKLHELTTAYHLNGGKHLSKEHKEHFDRLTTGMTKEEIKDHMHRGKLTAEAIRDKLKSEGKTIESVHITSKAGDIGRVTGKDESQHDNPSDIIVKVKPKKGKSHYQGYSLKTVNQKNGHAGMANPGHGRLDSDLKINTQEYIKKGNDKLEKEFPKELKGKTAKQKKEVGKENPKIKERATEVMKGEHSKIVDHMVKRLNEMSPDERVHFVRKHFHLEHSETPHERVTIHGTGKDAAVRIEHPGEEGDSIKHVEVKKHGNNTIAFHVHHHDGSISRYHLRAKPESGPFSTLKFSAEFRGKQKPAK